MKNSIFITVVFILFFLVLLIGNYFLVLSHEQAHQAIFGTFGVNSTITVGYLGIGNSYTKANLTDLSKLSTEDYRMVQTLNSINEIFGYQITVMYILVGMLFITITTMLSMLVLALRGKK